MEQILALFATYQNYILLSLLAVLSFLVGRTASLASAVALVYAELMKVVGWFARALSEADGNGGKPSFTKILGTYVVFKIVFLAADIVRTGATVSIPSELMTLFMFLIGYQMVSKVLLENPALMELIKGKYGISQPKKEDPA